MAKRPSRPSWFKMFLHQKALLDAMPDETVGKALKAVFQYFDAGELPDLDPMAFAVFAAIKPYVDESFEDFERTSEKNRRNVEARWKKTVANDNTTGTSCNDMIQTDTDSTNGNNRLQTDTTDTEAETEADAEADASVKGNNVKKEHKEIEGKHSDECITQPDLAHPLSAFPSNQHESLQRVYAVLLQQGHDHEGAMLQIEKISQNKGR